MTDNDSNSTLPLAKKLGELEDALELSTTTVAHFVFAAEEAIEAEREKWTKTRENFTVAIDKYGGQMRRTDADRAEDDHVMPDISVEQFEKQIGTADKLVERTNEFPQHLYNMCFVYVMGMWEAYITDSVRAVLCERPEMMRERSKKVSYNDLLNRRDGQTIVEFLADREALDVGHASMKDRLKGLEDRFHIDLDSDPNVSSPKLIEMDARRNILLHNGGAANSLYAGIVPDSDVSPGTRLDADRTYFQDAYDSLRASAWTIRRQLVDKFSTAVDAASKAPADPASG